MRIIIALGLLLSCVASSALAAETIGEPRGKAAVKQLLITQNKALAKEWSEFIELNKRLAADAMDDPSQMLVFRKYGAAVIKAKKCWIDVVGNPKKYDTWLESEEYAKAWSALERAWKELMPPVEQFAALDQELADTITDGLTTLATSFDEYRSLIDEWHGEVEADTHRFAAILAAGGGSEVDQPDAERRIEAQAKRIEARDRALEATDTEDPVGEAEDEAVEKEERKEDKAVEADTDDPAEIGNESFK